MARAYQRLSIRKAIAKSNSNTPKKFVARYSKNTYKQTTKTNNATTVKYSYTSSKTIIKKKYTYV